MVPYVAIASSNTIDVVLLCNCILKQLIAKIDVSAGLNKGS